MKTDKYKIILASNSPRRKELLAGLGCEFEVRVIPGLDESYSSDMLAEEVPHFLAKKKAAAYSSSIGEEELVVTADTVVLLEGAILEKPRDREEAIGMLRRLSGRSHQVLTGVSLMTKHAQHTFTERTMVYFSEIADEDIVHYVDRFSPFDKAGSYGIQEWIGYVGVERIEGCFYNVMGLPVHRLYHEMKSFLD